MKNKENKIKITKEIETSSAEGKVLGQRVSAPQNYCPEILVRVPRSENRLQYDIHEDNLPFIGYDVWNGYEVSCLTEKGYPLFVCCKIVYPCNNKYIVESKSLKLYLNSFNMERYGTNKQTAKEYLTEIIKKDLSLLLECEVSIYLYDNNDVNYLTRAPYESYDSIEKVIDVYSIEFNDFNENKDLINITASEDNKTREYRIEFPMLRSNCKITHQPDWGTAFIYIKSEQIVDLDSLCKYIVSFRNENHFHEECVEMIYKRLYDKLKSFNPDFLLAVSAIYCRRGGIDICPTRSNSPSLFDANLINPTSYCEKLLNQ